MTRRFVVAVSLVVVICSGRMGYCAEPGTPGLSTTTTPDNAMWPPIGSVHQKVYWTLFTGKQPTQVQTAKVPLTATSKDASIHNSSQNDLLSTSGMAVDSAGRLWILSYGQANTGNPTYALVFNLPLTAKSVPLHIFTLSNTSGADDLAFDSSGDIWVSSPGNQSVLEYTGPFTQSGILTPTKTLTNSIDDPFAVAVDKNANVYISNYGSTGTHSITVMKPPYTGKPYFLDGLTAPGGLVFDNVGNLYASSNGSTPSVVRYNSNHLKSGDKPSIVDPAGLGATSYEAAFAFTAHGDLYAANCGNNGTAGIQVWPLRQKKFSPKLAPSVNYTNKQIQLVGCAWGIAIK